MTRTRFLTLFAAAALFVLSASAQAQVIVTSGYYAPRARVVTAYSAPVYLTSPQVTYVQPYIASYEPAVVYRDVGPYTVGSSVAVVPSGVSIAYTRGYPVYPAPVVTSYYYPRRLFIR